MSAQRRVLLTTPYDLAVEGGVNNQLWGLYKALKKMAGYDVRIIGPSSDPGGHDCPDLYIAGRVISLPLNRAMSNITPDIRILPRVKTLLEEFRPHIIHLQEPLLPLLNTMVLYFSRAATVGTYHTYAEKSRGYEYWRPILQWHQKRVRAKIAVSDAARRFVSQVFPDEYHIIPNAVDMPRPMESRGSPAAGNRRKEILFVGRMNEPRKGFTYLLDAYRLLETRYPGQYCLVVAGSGRDEIAGKTTEGDIRWKGRISSEELHHLYDSCDVVCTPSLGGESFGIVLLEAFSHGKPVAASDITGYREFAGDSGAAVFVPPGSAEDIAAEVVRITTGDLLYRQMSSAALAVAEAHTWPRIVERIIRIYDALLADQGMHHRS